MESEKKPGHLLLTKVCMRVKGIMEEYVDLMISNPLGNIYRDIKNLISYGAAAGRQS